MTEKYLKHGLTRDQDAILGGFGHTLDEIGHPTDRVHLDMYDVSPFQRPELEKAAKQLVSRKLLYIDQDEYGNEMYNLTLKGKQLWKITEYDELLERLHSQGSIFLVFGPAGTRLIWSTDPETAKSVYQTKTSCTASDAFEDDEYLRRDVPLTKLQDLARDGIVKT